MSSSVFQPSLLLASRKPNVEIGPFDGLVAAHISHHSNLQYICTTPNQRHVPCPPTTSIHSPRIRADLRYGIHDHTLFPQPYIIYYSHLGAIPRKPNDPNHPLAVMWWDPTPEDFVASTGGILLGTGSLCRSKVQTFGDMNESLQARVIAYRESTTPVPPQHALDLIATCATALSNAFVRLASLKVSYTQTRFTVTEFQRYYLELVGLLDYMQIYQPRMRGLHPVASTVDERVGVFALNEVVVQEFHRAGLPVWYVRPWTGEPFANNVLEVVNATPSNACMDDHDPPFPSVYTGALGGRQVLDSIHQFSRNWLTYKDPFLGRPLQIVPQGSLVQSHPTSSSSSSSKTRKQQKQGNPVRDGRNKFLPLEGPLAPFSIPAWAYGLSTVDTSLDNLVENSKSEAHFGHYVFPDPGIFTTPQQDGKKRMLLRTWLLCREAWLSCLASNNSLALSAQAWRDILFLDFSNPPSISDTRKSARRQESLAKFQAETLEAFRVQPQYAAGQPVVWNGQEYTLTDELPPANTVREILWELYELNFMYELISLDRRACSTVSLTDQTSLYEREEIIRKCFPFLTFKMPSCPLPTTNTGLASDSPSERLGHILQLAKLMSTWHGEKPAILCLHERKSQDSISRQHVSELEREVAQFYCQTFYNYFGRAAQVPHRLYRTI